MKTITVPFGRKHPVDVEYDRAGPYPVALRMPRNTVDREYPLNREEAVALRDALTVALEYDPTSYVQVKFAGQSRHDQKTYTYVDPFGDLAPGDLVDVPTIFEEHNVATVVSLGKAPDYYGTSPRTVTARYSREAAA